MQSFFTYMSPIIHISCLIFIRAFKTIVGIFNELFLDFTLTLVKDRNIIIFVLKEGDSL